MISLFLSSSTVVYCKYNEANVLLGGRWNLWLVRALPFNSDEDSAECVPCTGKLSTGATPLLTVLSSSGLLPSDFDGPRGLFLSAIPCGRENVLEALKNRLSIESGPDQ